MSGFCVDFDLEHSSAFSLQVTTGPFEIWTIDSQVKIPLRPVTVHERLYNNILSSVCLHLLVAEIDSLKQSTHEEMFYIVSTSAKYRRIDNW